MTLADFLAARLDGDEAAAKASYYEGQRWITEEEEVCRWPDDEPVHSANRKVDAEHIARHDPARVLREVEAKRKILALHVCAAAELDGSPGNPEVVGWAKAAAVAARDVAAVYSDHPDYSADLA
jgi:Family of unknown function (DUF6221)